MSEDAEGVPTPMVPVRFGIVTTFAPDVPPAGVKVMVLSLTLPAYESASFPTSKLPFGWPTPRVVIPVVVAMVKNGSAPKEPNLLYCICPFEPATELPAVPFEAAVIRPLALTVIFAFVKLPTFVFTVASVAAEEPGPEAVTSPVRAVM